MNVHERKTKQLLTAIRDRILHVGNPDKIVLFGSRARGDAKPESDYDILVIEPSDVPRYKRSAKYRKALVGVVPSKDLVVWTPEEIHDWSEVPNAFITAALREGIVLHEKHG